MTQRSIAETSLPWPRLVTIALLLTCLLAPGHIATPDAHLRLAQARNLVSEGSFAVPEGVGHLDHGNLAPGRDGRMYSVYNPGHVVLLAPIYAIASSLPTPFGFDAHYAAAFGASFLGLIAHFLTGLLLLAFLVRIGVDRESSLLAAALFAFGTVSLPHATDGYEHPFEALAVLSSFYLLASRKDRSTDLLHVVVGLVLGLGIAFRYTAVLALPGLAIVARGWRERFLIGLGTIPSIFGMLLYNWYRFGSFFDTGYPTAWRISHGETAIGRTGFDPMNIPENLANLLLSPGKGLLWYAPVLVLVVPAWKHFRDSRAKLADGICIATLLYLTFYSANFAWHGSVWTWGPRYTIPIVPMLMLSIGFLISRRRWRRAVLVVGTVSVLIQTVAVSADYRRHLLEEYSSGLPNFEERLLHDPSASPVLAQFESAGHVVSETLGGGDFEPFIPPGPWRTVARPASIEMMLVSSVDLNVINVWWVRLVFLTSNRVAQILSIVFGGLLMIAAFRLSRSVWTAVRGQ